jgi:hypothetical protein
MSDDADRPVNPETARGVSRVATGLGSPTNAIACRIREIPVFMIPD